MWASVQLKGNACSLGMRLCLPSAARRLVLFMHSRCPAVTAGAVILGIVRIHFLFDGWGHTHRSRLECGTEPDYCELPPSRFGQSAEIRFIFRRWCQTVGGGGVTAHFCSGDFLFWAKGQLKVLPPVFPPLQISHTHQPMRESVDRGGSDADASVGVSGRSGLRSLHTVSFWTPSS